MSQMRSDNWIYIKDWLIEQIVRNFYFVNKLQDAAK